MTVVNEKICPFCTADFFTILNDFDAFFVCKLYSDIYLPLNLDFNTFMLENWDQLVATKG